MIASIIKYVSLSFTGNLPIINMVLSIIPFLGSKVAIPYTTNIDIWRTKTLQPLEAFLFSTLACVGLIVILGLLFAPISYLIKKSKFYNSFKNSNSAHKRTPMSTLEKCTIIAIIKSIPLVGCYLSTLIGAFNLKISENIIANTVGAIICSLLSALLLVNDTCKIIAFLVIMLEMLTVAGIVIIHYVVNTPSPKKHKRQNTH